MREYTRHGLWWTTAQALTEYPYVMDLFDFATFLPRTIGVERTDLAAALDASIIEDEGPKLLRLYSRDGQLLHYSNVVSERRLNFEPVIWERTDEDRHSRPGSGREGA